VELFVVLEAFHLSEDSDLMEKRKIYVHIGLPKTATTSLQRDLFPRVAELVYAGTCLPRVSKYDGDTVYGAFMLGMYSGETRQFEAALSKMDAGEDILISEEMITVVTSRSDWKQNLNRMRQLLEPYDYRLLVTVRDPLDAMFSYYVERFDYFQGIYKKFDEAILESVDMGIYRYSRFLKYLGAEFGSERIVVADYRDIISGRFTAIERFLERPMPVDSAISNHNSKYQSKSGIYLKNKASIYDYVCACAKKYQNIGILWAVAKRIGSIIKPILLFIPWRRSVPLLSDSQKEQCRKILAEDIDQYHRVEGE
jgi:hypothetical protein